MNNFEFNLDFKNRLEIFKKNLWLSKKYWILYIIILLIFTLMRFELENYAHPELEIIAFVLLVLCGTETSGIASLDLNGILGCLDQEIC